MTPKYDLLKSYDFDSALSTVWQHLLSFLLPHQSVDQFQTVSVHIRRNRKLLEEHSLRKQESPNSFFPPSAAEYNPHLPEVFYCRKQLRTMLYDRQLCRLTSLSFATFKFFNYVFCEVQSSMQ